MGRAFIHDHDWAHIALATGSRREWATECSGVGGVLFKSWLFLLREVVQERKQPGKAVAWVDVFFEDVEGEIVGAGKGPDHEEQQRGCAERRGDRSARVQSN